ncbi:MAG: phosphate ABC transporter substrate-binding protein PstS, partial [Gemmatimonadales bacterium]
MAKKQLERIGLAMLAAATLAVPAALAAQSLNGAGGTFINPLMQKWVTAYAQKTGVKINYQSVGSGAGIQQYTQGTVDFGESDGPLTDKQLAAVDGKVLHIPATLGAVVLTWNVPALGKTKLRFDGPTIANIYLGKITKWNDPAIARMNPGVKLPSSDIIVVHRSDGSGTTYIFTDYLSKVSPEWKEKVGNATSVNWPVGLGGKGSEGVTQQVKQVEGGFGYVELIYALANNLAFADVKNPAGTFVTPSLATTTSAAAGAKFPPNTDFRVSITNAPGPQAYPISSFTWFLVRPDMTDATKAKAMKAFLQWMVSPEAQGMAPALQYAPLPKEIITLEKARFKTLKA